MLNATTKKEGHKENRKQKQIKFTRKNTEQKMYANIKIDHISFVILSFSSYSSCLMYLTGFFAKKTQLVPIDGHGINVLILYFSSYLLSVCMDLCMQTSY